MIGKKKGWTTSNPKVKNGKQKGRRQSQGERTGCRGRQQSEVQGECSPWPALEKAIRFQLQTKKKKITVKGELRSGEEDGRGRDWPAGERTGA